MFTETPRRIGEFILKYRWLIIAANMLVLILLGYSFKNRAEAYSSHIEYMTMLRNNPMNVDSSRVSPPPIFDADYHVWFDSDNEDLQIYDQFQDIFSKEENLIMVVRVKEGDIFTNENLQSLKFLTENAWTVPYVSRVDGLTNFNYTYVEDDDLLVEDFIDSLPLSPAELATKRQLALSDSLMPHFLISKSADITSIQLRVTIPREFASGYIEARDAVEAFVAQLKNPTLLNEAGVEVKNPNYNPAIEVHLGGTTLLNTAFQRFAQADIQNLLPVMFLVIMLFLALTMRSFWGTVSPMILLATSVFFPVALFVAVFQFSLTNVTVNVLQMLVAVAIADSVHILTIFFRGLRNGLDKKAAVIFTVTKNFLPCLITSITTGIGFYSIIFQDIPPFKDLGLFAGTGTLYAFFASVFTLPAFLSILPFKKRPVDKAAIAAHENKGYEGLTRFVFVWQKQIRWLAVATAVISFYYIFQIKVDNTAVKYFAPHTEFRKATAYIDNNIIGTNPVEFNFDSGEENGIYDPDFLRKIEKFQNYIKAHPEYNITYVSSIVDIVKRLNKTMHGNDPDYYRIPENNEVTAEGDTIDARRLIAQYLLLYQMSLPQGMELTNQIDIRNRQTRVTAYAKSVSSYKLLGHSEIINSWIEENIPTTKARAVGVPIMFGKLMKIAIPGMLKGLLVSFVFITVVLMLTFRSVKVGIYSMIPNIWPIGFVFGMIGFLGIPVNMSVAVVGMITMGIAVDDTVHFLTKYIRGRDYEGLGQRESILFAYRQVAAPLIFTSIILIMGFGTLTQSDFVLNSDMALYCTIVIALALFADFVLLPATILKFDGKFTKAGKQIPHRKNGAFGKKIESASAEK